MFAIGSIHLFNTERKQTMFEEFKKLLVDELQIEEEKITPEANLNTDLGINSIELAELVMRCEETFNIEIEEEALQNFATIGDVVSYLEKNAK